MEVKTIGENLTEEQKHIADFWDDNPFKLNVIGHVNFVTKNFSPSGPLDEYCWYWRKSSKCRL